MARKRAKHTKEELKKLILKAAREVVLEEGTRELSTRKIMARTGYAVGTLYNFFENLDDVILHLNGQTLDLLQEQLSVIQEKTSKNHPVQLLAHRYFDFSEQFFSEWQLLFEYPMPPKMKYPAWYQKKISQIFELIESRLETRLNVSKEVLFRASRVLWSGVHGICMLYHTGKLKKTKSETPKVLADDFITHYLNGLTAST